MSSKEYLTHYGEYVSIYKFEDTIYIYDEFNDFVCNFKEDNLNQVMGVFNNIKDDFIGYNSDTIDDEDYEIYEDGDLEYDEIHISESYKCIDGNWVILGRCEYIYEALEIFKEKYDEGNGSSLKALLKKYKEVRKTKCHI